MTNSDQSGRPSQGLGGQDNVSAPAPGETLSVSESGGVKRVGSWSDLHFKLLEGIVPPSVIVDENYNILHLSEGAGRYLKFSGGEATTYILRLVHPMLRANLRAALSQAAETGSIIRLDNMPAEFHSELRLVNVYVRRNLERAPICFLIVFEPTKQAAVDSREATLIAGNQVLQQLETELEEANAQLRSTVAQYEVSNEKLQSMNEELRSANEELETSREELKVINDQLNFFNDQLKKSNEELSRANSDLQNLMASTDIATIFLDRQLYLTRYTPAAVELFNLIPSDIGRPFLDLRHRLEYHSLAEDAEHVLRDLVRVERPVRSGESRFLMRIFPYRALDDKIDGVVLTLVNISELERAQSALQESEEQLRLIIENAREFAIFSTDRARHVTRWNIGAERLLGFSEKEILGRSADIIFTPEDFAAGIPEQEAQIALTKGQAADERWHLRKNGSRFWGSGYMMTMEGADRTIIGFVKILHDRTAARQIEENLEASRQQLWKSLQETERARAEAEAAGRAKDQFLAVLSHELRTPLTPVLTATEWLLRRQDLPARVTEGLKMIQRNVELEARFIDDLLDITRISRGKLDLVREPMDLHDAIRSAVEVSEPDIQSKGQKLTVELKAERQRVRGDARRLQQVFWNLLKNASKFTPDGGEIRIISGNEPGYIMAQVTDTGIGIDPGALEHIFEEFRQGGDFIARKFGGLGLGLAIAKATVESHEGSIAAASHGSGQGATFTIKLPLLADE